MANDSEAEGVPPSNGTGASDSGSKAASTGLAASKPAATDRKDSAASENSQTKDAHDSQHTKTSEPTEKPFQGLNLGVLPMTMVARQRWHQGSSKND